MGNIQGNILVVYKQYTLSIPNYLSVLIGIQIWKNLWWICKNAQLGSNSGLNKLSNELFYTQNGIINKRIWWFDQGCNLVFMFNFQNFASRCIIICHNTLELAEIWNLD
jgi:hypothetical protein